jgi:hypothetical protein
MEKNGKRLNDRSRCFNVGKVTRCSEEETSDMALCARISLSREGSVESGKIEEREVKELRSRLSIVRVEGRRMEGGIEVKEF